MSKHSESNTMSSVHFIVVNYNSGDWLSRSLLSIVEHGGLDEFCVTVVDNASSDNSMQLAQQACATNKIDWVFNQENVGFAAANNQVLRELEADFAVLINPDCELSKGAMKLILSAFEANKSYGLASGRILNEDGSLQVTCRRRFPTPWSALVRILMLHRLFPNHPKFADFDYGVDVNKDDENQSVEAISGAFMVARKQAIAKVGLLDEGYFMHCEDLDWCKRFELSGWEVGFIPAAKVIHAQGVSSKARPIGVLWTLHKGMNRFYDKFYRDSYSWPLRSLVKLGIAVSFGVRATKAILSMVFSRG